MMSCANEIKLCNLCFPDDPFFSESWSRYHSRVCWSVFLSCFEIPNSQVSLKFMYHNDWCCISYFTVELPSLCLVNQFFFNLPCSLWLGSLSVCGLAISHDESRHHNLCFLMMMQTYCLDLLPFFFFSNRVIILKQTTIHFGNGQASCTCCLTGKVRIWVHMILDWPWAINAHPFYLKPSVKSDIEYCFPTLADFRCQSHLVFQIVCSEMRYNLAEPLHDHFLFM